MMNNRYFGTGNHRRALQSALQHIQEHLSALMVERAIAGTLYSDGRLLRIEGSAKAVDAVISHVSIMQKETKHGFKFLLYSNRPVVNKKKKAH